MKTLLVGLLPITLLAFPRNSQCRIGETLEECKTRYGKPVEIKKDTALFFKNGMSVFAHFIDGTVDQITYYRTDPKDTKKKSALPTQKWKFFCRQMLKTDHGKWSLLAEITQFGGTKIEDWPRPARLRSW